MRPKLLGESDGVRTVAIVLDPGDEAFQSIPGFAKAQYRRCRGKTISAFAVDRRPVRLT
jgi:hypothetical protein